MANDPVIGSQVICGVSPTTGAGGQIVPVKISVDDSQTPPAVIVDIPSNALRDLGIVTIDGAVSAESSTIYVGTTAATPKFATISTSSSGATEIVAAVTDKKIRVIAAALMANGTVNVKWQSAATDKTGLAYLVVNTGYVLPFNPVGWFQTAVSEALNINLSGAQAVGGQLVYIEA